MAKIQEQENQPPVPTLTVSYAPSSDNAAAHQGELSSGEQKVLQQLREQTQVAEAACDECDTLGSASHAGGDILGSMRVSAAFDSQLHGFDSAQQSR